MKPRQPTRPCRGPPLPSSLLQAGVWEHLPWEHLGDERVPRQEVVHQEPLALQAQVLHQVHQALLLAHPRQIPENKNSLLIHLSNILIFKPVQRPLGWI